MLKKVILFLFILGALEGVSWWVYRTSTKSQESTPSRKEEAQPASPATQEKGNVSVEPSKKPETNPTDVLIEDAPPVIVSGQGWDAGSFPPPQTEVVNGVTERTIHMGVRQFEWDPKVIRAKEGELVRLVIHNADVKHGFAVPELGVNEDISEDGAVITFKATKKGTFDFMCSVYCGVGHAEMQGKIIIE